jgi:hypothetical protein
MEGLGVDMGKVVRDGELIRRRICPVCEMEMPTTGKRPDKTLKAHIFRKREGEHFAWRMKYWGIHFCRNGWATRTRDQQFKYVLKSLKREFGQDLIDAIKAVG